MMSEKITFPSFSNQHWKTDKVETAKIIELLTPIPTNNIPEEQNWSVQKSESPERTRTGTQNP